METMQAWFGLKDEHNDFAIETDADARLFFARHELNRQLMGLLRRSFRTGNPPKMVLYGDWGVGKTHTMRHLEYVIETTDEFPARVVFRELPDITSKSTFQVAHAALLDALGFELARDWMKKFMTKHPDDFEEIIKERTQSGDIAAAFGLILVGRGDSSRSAWDWLRGVTLSAADARSAGLGPALSQSNEFVRVLQLLGFLCSEAEDKMLVFMLDEATKLDAVVNQDSIHHWTNALKLIADQQTKEIGFVASGSWIDLENMAYSLQDQQVVSRFGESHYIMLHRMNEDETREFIRSLLSEWVDSDKRVDLINQFGSETQGEEVDEGTFPFTNEGLELAVQYACRTGGSTLPRDIQQTLDDLLNRAIDEQRRILSHGYVSSVVNA
ncbi:hypothetical protein [Wenzhouxiangella sp. XN24]|uniref:AAA family ATPase n=1 Tax=Wenzhouxiangella sp. XN24 TaxID=2713569 RepID=UPI0013EB67F2|nr:hypothetical protein [Wenzhouxiangella sp. XN24]NGX16023.1 hypothetical protein [Wenzhouxiangella sp. XN24]